MPIVKKIKKLKTRIKNEVSELPYNERKSRVLGLTIIIAGVFLVLANTASAFVPVPAAGSFAFDIYDVAVNDILNGPIGFVGGVASMAMGGVMAIQQKLMLAIPCVLGGAGIMTADTITTSLGAVV